MKNEHLSKPARRKPTEAQSHWPWYLGTACLLLLSVGLFRSQPRFALPATKTTTMNEAAANSAVKPSPIRNQRLVALEKTIPDIPQPSAEEIVAGKVSQFARIRRDVVYTMARKLEIGVPDDVRQFFDAVEAGRWEEIDARFQLLLQRKRDGEGSTELTRLWGPIFDAYGVADQVHSWPAQKLLDYGNAVLDSLRPRMVYLGGTDEGRWIPTLLNETGDREHHIILTQNALADQSYLTYLEFLHGDQIAALDQKDSERAFSDYLSNAQRRLEHDRQFPDEPKQLRPNEDVRIVDGKVHVSGQVAVMDINERLLRALMEKNPDRSFALQESFPFKSTYGDAAPLGPIMELRADNSQGAFTSSRAAQTVDYWRTITQRLLSDPDAQASPDSLASFAALAVSQGNLLADHKFGAEAEQAYRLATALAPSNPQAVLNYTNLLMDQKRAGEAVPVLETALAAGPDNEQLRRLLAGIKSDYRN